MGTVVPLVFCGFFIIVALVGSSESGGLGIFSGSDDLRADFVSTLYNPTSGEQEVRVSLGNVRGVEMTVPGVGETGVFVRRMSDGKRVAYGIYTSVDNMADCGVERTKAARASFDEMFSLRDQLYRDVAKALNRKSADGKTRLSSHHARNHTIVLLKRGEDHAQYNHLVDIDGLTKACKALYKQVIQDEKEKLHSAHLPSLSALGQEETEADTDSHQRTKRHMLIYPNTKWCGAGSTARSYGDLGENKQADRCCREHDHCPDYIERFTSKYSLFNYRLHTISSCDCDKQFRACLKGVNDSDADMVGNIYFNVIGITCFRMKKERACTERSWWGSCNKWDKTPKAVVKEPKPYKRKIRKRRRASRKSKKE